MFSQDRDLLALDPSVFKDVSPATQPVHSTTGDLAGGTLTLYEPLPTNAAVPGAVVLVANTPMEVLEVTDPSTVVVSLARASADDPQIAPADRTAAAVVFTSFAGPRALAHAHILTLLGLDPANSINPFSAKETAVTNPRALATIECLHALFLIYCGTSIALPNTALLSKRADFYEQRFAHERFNVRAELDLDGDGLPDATRTLNLTHLLRA